MTRLIVESENGCENTVYIVFQLSKKLKKVSQHAVE